MASFLFYLVPWRTIALDFAVYIFVKGRDAVYVNAKTLRLASAHEEQKDVMKTRPGGIPELESNQRLCAILEVLCTLEKHVITNRSCALPLSYRDIGD